MVIGSICYSTMVSREPSRVCLYFYRHLFPDLPWGNGFLSSHPRRPYQAGRALRRPGALLCTSIHRYKRVISLADSRLETMGWNYWYNWTIVLPAELSAAAVLIDFWDKDTNLNSAWVTICLVVVVAINFMGAGVSP